MDEHKSAQPLHAQIGPHIRCPINVTSHHLVSSLESAALTSTDANRYFPKPAGKPNDIDAYHKRVDETFVTDAYNSLSFEVATSTRAD